MRKRRHRDTRAAIDYHVNRNHAAVFEGSGQQQRIDKCRALITKALAELKRPATIWELGCGSCDISGPFSYGNKVTGIDCVAEAPQVIAQRYSNVQAWVIPIEMLKPQPVDVLVMCEFLEHIAEPMELVKAWLPLAQYSIIGHPLDEPDAAGEEGHCWSYSRQDFQEWFKQGGHELVESEEYPMSIYPAMALGLGKRL